MGLRERLYGFPPNSLVFISGNKWTNKAACAAAIALCPTFAIAQFVASNKSMTKDKKKDLELKEKC